MKLVNMRNNNTEPRPEVVPSMGMEAYPWELRITLNTDMLDRLGIDIGNLKAGAAVSVQAKAKVTEIRSSERETDNSSSLMKDTDQSLTLQITDMGVADENDFDLAFKEAQEDED